MLENAQIQPTQACKDCIKNKNLLKKYEKLTNLYEKKQLKLTANGSSLISNGKTTNNTLVAQSSFINCMKMVEALNTLMRNRCHVLFRMPSVKSAKKFVLFNICNRLAKFSKAKAFSKIKQLSSNKAIGTNRILQQNSELMPQVWARKDYKGFSVIKQLIAYSAIKPEDFAKKAVQELQYLKETAQVGGNNEKQLHRKNMLLQILNKKLVLENNALKECIQELDKRLSKQNQKKRETLEELADEINDKNQEINQLKQTLRAYQITHNIEDKVLQDDLVSMKKDLEELQKLNERLNNDLEKVKDQLIDTNKKLKISEQKNVILSKQCTASHKQIHELTLQVAKSQKLSNEYSTLIKSLDKKLKRLTIYEKYLQQNKTNNQNVNTRKIQQELKSQFILMFLNNISDADYLLKSQHLFDEEQKSFLMSHKENWIKNENEIHLKGRQNHHQSKMDCLEISEIGARGIQMESMMNALDSPRNHGNREREGPTMRMLELELENNRQVGKITELKEKFLHIRVIILRLLKSMELTSDIKSEAKDILRVLFDLFEYSQQQRDSIFIKKKRMFGFI